MTRALVLIVANFRHTAFVRADLRVSLKRRRAGAHERAIVADAHDSSHGREAGEIGDVDRDSLSSERDAGRTDLAVAATLDNDERRCRYSRLREELTTIETILTGHFHRWDEVRFGDIGYRMSDIGLSGSSELSP